MPKPKYYVTKTLIGSDKSYLPLLDNIVWMSKMTDPKLKNLEAYIIMDLESVEMTKSNLHSNQLSYYEFIENSGCKILLVEDLIKKTFSLDGKLKEKAEEIYKNLSSYNQIRFEDISSETLFEVLPKTTQADFIKALCLGGFYDQHSSSVNICMDLDVTQSGISRLPDDPENFLPGKVAGYDRKISYHPQHLNFLNDEEKERIQNNPELQEKWEAYVKKITSGGSHEAF